MNDPITTSTANRLCYNDKLTSPLVVVNVASYVITLLQFPPTNKLTTTQRDILIYTSAFILLIFISTKVSKSYYKCDY